MAKAPKMYRKLPGRGATFTHYTRLYEGPDHLLQVHSTGFTETYKRFYFRDIQAIAIRKTNTGKMINAVIGAALAVLAVPALFTTPPVTVVLSVFAGVFALFLGVNVALGPTCVSYLRTAVQDEKIPSLSRLPRARRVLRRLKARITEAQGEWNAHDVRAAGPQPGSPEEGSPPIISATA